MSDEIEIGKVKHWKQLTDSDTVRACDLVGRGVVVRKIAKVRVKPKFADGRKCKAAIGITFEGSDKTWLPCGAACNAMSQAFHTPAPAKWIGCNVAIYAEEGIRNPSDGSVGYGTRVNVEKTIDANKGDG